MTAPTLQNASSRTGLSVARGEAPANGEQTKARMAELVSFNDAADASHRLRSPFEDATTEGQRGVKQWFTRSLPKANLPNGLMFGERGKVLNVDLIRKEVPVVATRRSVGTRTGQLAGALQ